jgi:nicotinate-nucleotide adenylyltransferase
VLARDAMEKLGLDRLFIVPTGMQPLKTEKTDGASPEHRLEMARIAFAGDESVSVDETEVRRPGLSFTVDTLESYSSANPGSEIFLLLGRDSFESLDSWKRPERIRQLSTIALIERGDESGEAAEEGVVVAAIRRIDVSSSEIRERRMAGKSIAGFVPDAVLEYIDTHNLYAPRGARQE